MYDRHFLRATRDDASHHTDLRAHCTNRRYLMASTFMSLELL